MVLSTVCGNQQLSRAAASLWIRSSREKGRGTSKCLLPGCLQILGQALTLKTLLASTFTEEKNNYSEAKWLIRHLTHFKDCLLPIMHISSSKIFLDVWWVTNSVGKGPDYTKALFVILNVGLKTGPQT